MVIRPIDLSRFRIIFDQLRGCVAGYDINIIIVFLIIIRPVPYQFIDRIVVHFFLRRKISETGMHQQIFFPVYFQFFIEQKLPQKIQYILPLFLIQLIILIQRRIVSVLLPGPEIIQCFLVQLHNGLFRDLLHQKVHTLQRHQLMVSQDRYGIGHFHQFLQYLDRMRSPVDHIPDQIQCIFILKIYFFQQFHELVILSMDITHYISCHVFLLSVLSVSTETPRSRIPWR